MSPEHLHAIFSHLLVLGVALGLFATLLACWLRSRAARVVGLSVLFLSTACAYPVFYLGHEGYRRIRPVADEQGEAWLDLHLDRAESGIWAYHLAAIATALAVLLPRWRPQSEKPLLIASLVTASLALATGGWIATAGGRVRHPEFRPAEPLPLHNENADYEVEP